jgi:hypothetical protein
MNAIRSDFELLEKVQSRRYVLRHLEHSQTPMCPEDSVLKNISIPQGHQKGMCHLVICHTRTERD